MRKYMRHMFFVLMLCCWGVMTAFGNVGQSYIVSSLQNWISLDGTSRAFAQTDILRVSESTEQSLRVSVDLTDLSSRDVDTERGWFSQIEIPGMNNSTRIGEPMLPVNRKIITAPIGAIVVAEVLSFTTQDVSLPSNGIQYPVMPAQPSLSKSQRAEDVPFAYNEAAYTGSGSATNPVVHVEELGILRGMRLLVLVVEPVRYNPAAQTLTVYNNLNIVVRFNNGDMAATRDLRDRTASSYFESVYSQHVINSELGRSGSLDEDLTHYPIKYLIISDPMFTAQLEPFIQWKTKQGYEVVVGYTNNPLVGTTTTSIKAYIQSIYDAGTPQHPAPSFILFVGDVDQIPANTGTAGSHITDLAYAQLSGGDFLPDVYYGRFSANNTTELQPQIDKTLEYEKYLMPDPSYLGRCVMIAGQDATYGPLHGDGQINYGTNYYFNAAHGLTSNTYLYAVSGTSDAQIIANASEGRGYINYTAHGSETSWGDPSFSVSDVNGLTNNHKYGTVVGNCCLTNRFQVTTCFGESWLRAANKGAIGYIGATNNSYWDEDYWWGVGAEAVSANPTMDLTKPGAYDGMFHDHSETFPNWYTTQYSFIMAGNLAVVQGGGATNYYWEIYSLMGDPSLSTYLGVPTANTVSYPATMFIGQTSITITAQAYSYVGLSYNNVLYAAGLVDATGSLTLTFSPFTAPCNADIVITRQNRIPVVSTIQVIPNNGPYVMTSQKQFSDAAGDNDGVADFGEALTLSLTEKNVGTIIANSVTVTISTTDTYFTITDNSETYGNIAPNAEVARPNGFAGTIATNVPNGHVIPITVVAADNASHTWTETYNITANAPVIVLDHVVVNDASGNNNGRLDPGETCGLEVVLRNSGGAGAVNLASLLSSTDTYITINDNNSSLVSLAAAATGSMNFNVSASGTTPVGHPANFVIATSATNYSANSSFTLSIGLSIEDFERGNFTAYPWESSGTAPWIVVNTGMFEGAYCSKSGTIIDSQTSELFVNAEVVAADTIHFYYKVSSELGYDYLKFSIDGVQLDQWSGEVTWTRANYPVTAGNHTFTWIYSKDGSVSSGSDCAWLDNIVFPPLGAPRFPDLSIDPGLFDVTVLSHDSTTRTLTVNNVGTANLNYTATAVMNSSFFATESPLKLAKGEADPRHGAATLDAQGGPDTYGYRWIDSDEPGGPAYNWVEISGSGTALADADDQSYGPLDLGFSFNFYGTNYTSIRVCTNGFLSFTSTETSYTNGTIPASGEPNCVIAPMWDDFNSVTAGTIYYYADAANNRFIAEWSGVSHYNSAGNPLNPETFQVIINGDGSIVCQYQIVADGAGCTVGMENSTGTDGLQVAFNAAYLHANMAIRLYADLTQPWLVVYPTVGTILPAGFAQLTVKFSARDIVDGQYTGSITITSNDPDEGSVVIPVTFNAGGPPDAVTNLTVRSEGANVILRWTPTNGTSYQIYASVDDVNYGTTPIATTTASTYTLTNEVTTYNKRYYKVVAVR